MSDRTRTVDGLELDQNPRQERVEGGVQRVAWGVMLLVVAAALLGAFGPGLLGPATASAPGVRVEYPRFVRMAAGEAVRVQIAPPAGAAEARLHLSQTYLDAVHVEAVTPEPDRVEAASDGAVYVFALAGTGGPIAVTFDVEARGPGRFGGTIGVPGAAPARLSQFAYP